MATYVEIASVTVGAGGASSISFSSIPSTYTDLKLVCSIRTNSADVGVFVYLNGDTTNGNYSTRRLIGDGSSASSASYSAPYWVYTDSTGETASTFASGEIYLPNYTDSSAAQSISSESVMENNATGALATMQAGLWNTTSAVNAVQLNTISGSFVQYSTAYLYGIKKD